MLSGDSEDKMVEAMIYTSKVTLEILKKSDPPAYNLFFMLACLPYGTEIQDLKKMIAGFHKSFNEKNFESGI